MPYAVRWTSEVLSPGPQLVPRLDGPDGRMRLSFHDEVPEDRIDGVLFLREGDSPGVGEPMWADVHTHRQRRCQVEGRCQVCGQVIEGRVTPWILPYGQLASRVGGTIVTDVAPTCGDCIAVALRHCPHLGRKPYRLIDVRGYRVHSYFGDVVDHSGIPGRPKHFQADRRIGGYLGNIMARQTIVELWDHRMRRT